VGTLYIDRKGLHIRLDGNALAFYANGEREGTAPINPLKRVIVVGNITLESPVLHRLSAEGVSMIFLSGRRLRFCGMLHGRLHNNGILRLRQYEKSLSDFCIEYSKEIVSKKLAAQLALMQDAVNIRTDLRFDLTGTAGIIGQTITKLDNPTLETATLMGLEGGASAAYFKAYIKLFADSLKFYKRTRRPPEDPVNAMLSLCYTLLHFEAVREIETIGLDPTIGFYHKFEYGRESLACDLVETYRPVVDRFVWRLFSERTFRDRDFAFEEERPGCYLKKESRKVFYPLYEEWAQAIRTGLVEDVRALARRLINGQDGVF
jgi:CRISPR-associated protein Cas1